jgi:hypothetical protein
VRIVAAVISDEFPGDAILSPLPRLYVKRHGLPTACAVGSVLVTATAAAWRRISATFWPFLTFQEIF